MNYQVINPEVPGSWSSDDIDRTVWPPEFSSMSFEFADWLGDDLVTSFPVYLASASLAECLTSAGIERVRFEPVAVTVDPQRIELTGDLDLPPWTWMRIEGRAWADPIWLDARCRLVVRDDALAVMQESVLQQARFEPAEDVVELELPEDLRLPPGARARQVPR